MAGTTITNNMSMSATTPANSGGNAATNSNNKRKHTLLLAASAEASNSRNLRPRTEGSSNSSSKTSQAIGQHATGTANNNGDCQHAKCLATKTSQSPSSASGSSTATSADNDHIARLNEVGIANLYAGDARVAQESFINALSSCSASALGLGVSSATSTHNGTTGISSTSSPSSSSTGLISSKTGFTSTPQLNIKKLNATGTTTGATTGTTINTGEAMSTSMTGTGNITEEEKKEETGNNSTGASGSNADDTANMHVYQREEYDEGMHIYKEALYLDNEASTLFRDATLMYNVGQTHLRTRQYQDAKRWFSLSLATFVEWRAATSYCEEEDSTLAPASTTTTTTMHTGCKTFLLNDVKIHHNIAFCYYCMGENDQAMLHYQSAFQRLQELGLGDADIAACCNSIGILHLCAGDSLKAMECLQLALNIYRRLLGAKASPVATCLSNIARVFFSRQEFNTALVLFQEALQIRQWHAQNDTATNETVTEDNASNDNATVSKMISSPVDEAAAMFNIGQTFQKLGNVQEALSHFEAFRKLAEPVLGKNHRDIATCIKAMACIHYETGNVSQACDLLEEAVQCSKAGTPTLELTCLLRDMGCLYSMTNQPEKALARHLETLMLQRQLYGPEDSRTNPNIMVTLLHIAQSYKKLGKYTKALQVYRGVYDIQLEVFGPKSLEVAATLCSIGLMLYLKQDLKSSLNYYQEALRVRQEHFQTNDNFDIAATFNSIGLIAFKMKKLDLAKDAFLNCIRIRVRLEATDCHRDIVTLYSNLGTVYLANGEDKEAIQMFNESIRLERKTLGDNHLGVAVSLQHLAQLHQDRGELELAHEYFAEALEITKDVDDSMMANKQRTICTLLNLMGNIHLMKAEVPQMMECFSKASRVNTGDETSNANGGTADQFNNLVIAGYTFYGISKMHPPCPPEA